jgi:nucleoside-diphosphate-sugar epimerase
MPEGVQCVAMDTNASSDSQLTALFDHAEVVIHAAGADGRFTSTAPALDAFQRSNVDPFFRLIPAMQRVGARRLVILGSYYTALARLDPRLPIMTRSAYPISRAEQADLAFSIAGETIDVAILELPYIFGAAPERGTLWGYVIDQIENAEGPIPVSSGGTACVTAKQVGVATAAAAEVVQGHCFFPIGSDNLSHLQIHSLFAEALGLQREFVVITPEEAHAAALLQEQQLAEAGAETGYHPLDLAVLQSSDLFLDPEPSMAALGFTYDDIGAAIAETVQATRRFGGAGPAAIRME